ncbi:MAG TPA: hypothetical protein VK601_31030 [Kofleriaceae bacterium]|nr:hypothetical protein [Kofleriaceae bacterium]
MSRSWLAAAARVVAAVAALGGLGAWADPPGFPSTPGTTPPPGTQPPGTVAQDDFALRKIVAIKKFAHDKEDDKQFAEHEASDRSCRIDADARTVTLTFNADGTLHCKLAEVAEGYEIEIYVLTIKDLYDTGNHYRVTVVPGPPLKTVPIHGTSADVKAELEVMRGLAAEHTEAGWWHCPTRHGPYHFESGTLTIALDEAAVSQETKLAIAPLYAFNLTVLAVVGPGLPSYSIADGKIAERLNQADLSYYFGIHAYPFSWHRNGRRQTLPGRYFSDDFTRWNDRLSLIVGINLSHPTEGGFVGGAIEVYGGVSITGGWQPRKYQKLHAGNAVGDMLMATEVPTDATWDLKGWGVGLSVDASLLKTVLAFIGK